ncbi:MAG: ABC transporter permease [Candidatus Sulfopaludibacter sp.]|nr:ABC transporter permease [Candidatus Sulfopaludibacter sp.]
MPLGSLFFRRDRGVSGLIVLVLALGIGGTTAIFTLLQAAFLDPLPYRDPERLVTVMENTGWIPNVSEFLEIRARNRTLEQLAFAEHLDMQLTGMGEPARVFVARVTASFFPMLGVSPRLGRNFLEEENQPGRAPAVILTDTFWRSHMAADPGAIGRTLRLDGRPATIVGVLPGGFQFDYPSLRIPEPVDIYVSYPIEPTWGMGPGANGHGAAVRVIGRLRKGVNLAQAQDDLRGVARALTSEYPGSFRNPQHNPSLFSFLLLPLREAIVGTQRSLLWLLLGGVAALLLIACANAAQLLLARGLRREREVAIRAALGATRLRLVRQFFIEGLVLACCGGAAGLLAAAWMTRLLVRWLPVRSPLLASAHLDARTIGFTMTVSLLSALLFAIVPAVKSTRWTPGPSLCARATAGEGNRWRHLMIAIETALSVFLLCGVGLVAQNLRALIATPMGFDPKGVLALRLKLPQRVQREIEPNAGVVFQEYLDRVEAIPGVDAAALVTGPPLRPARGGNSELRGVTEASGELKSITAWNHLVSPDYFRTLRIPVLAGRTFRRDDGGRLVTVAIVNEEFARRFGLGVDIVGKQLDDGPDPPIAIVGMAANVRTRGLQTAPFPEVYLSSLQLSWANVYFVVRSALPPGQLLKQVKAAIRTADPDQAVYGVQTMEEVIADSVAEPRFDTFAIGAFALLATLMAAAGMYSVIACLVTQRTGEIAIRMALGAGRGDIVRTVLGTTGLWVTAGLASGLAMGLAASHTIRSLTDAEAAASPAIYGAVMLLFLAVSLAAAWMPARRASRLDPAVALRGE